MAYRDLQCTAGSTQWSCQYCPLVHLAERGRGGGASERLSDYRETTKPLLLHMHTREVGERISEYPGTEVLVHQSQIPRLQHLG